MDGQKKRPFNTGYKAHTKTEAGPAAHTESRERNRTSENRREPHNDVLIGRNAVGEALRSGRLSTPCMWGKDLLRVPWRLWLKKPRRRGL